MTDDAEGREGTALAPDEAFGVLGSETRVRILQTLGGADEPLSFSALRERVGTRDSGQFNYHLDRLVGHFVGKSEAGYALRRPGQRVVEAVLSGAVTDDPVLEPTRVDQPCPYCGAPTEVSFRQERVERYCTECDGLYGRSARREEPTATGDRSYLGYLHLPPAGIEGRTAAEVLRAAFTWGYLEFLSAASGVCPRCSATVDHDVTVCEDHRADGGLCERCDRRHAVQFHTRCTNCIFETGSAFVMHLAAGTDLLAFVTAHGYNPVSEEWTWGWEYDEEVLSTDPFEARFTFAVDGDSITLAVDDDLTVTAVERR